MKGFIKGKKEREAAIIQQALIHSMNQLSYILLPTVIVLPDGMMVNKSEVDLHIRVCNPHHDKTYKIFWCSHIQSLFIISASQSCVLWLVWFWSGAFLTFFLCFNSHWIYNIETPGLCMKYCRYNKWIQVKPVLIQTKKICKLDRGTFKPRQRRW